LQGHRTRATGRTLSVRCSPDPCAERVGKRPHTGRAPPDAQASVRCLSSGALPYLGQALSAPDAQTQRPVLQKPASGECFLSEKHSRDFSKISTGAIEKMHFIFSKAPNPASQARREGERNPSSLYPSNFTSFSKCANTTTCKPTCARVLAFSQPFSLKELS